MPPEHQIEVMHAFLATHQHMIPPGVLSAIHPHDWIWTVRLSGPRHPIYKWVADFDAIRASMRECTVAGHYNWTTERINHVLTSMLHRRLPVGVRLVRSRLQEKEGQAAIFTPNWPARALTKA